MSAINTNDLNKLPAKLYVAPYVAGILSTYTPGTNDNTIIGQIEGGFTFTRLASVTDLQISTNVTDKRVKIEADECDTGTIYDASEPTIKASANWYESGNLSALNIVLGTTLLNVAGSLVTGATQLIVSGTKAYNEFVEIEHQNGDGSTISITSVVGATDGALVANTDYVKVKGEDGKYGILILDSATVTTMAQNFTITYNYTPTATKYTGLQVQANEIPELIVKIETCPDSTGKTDVHYLVQSSIDGEIVNPFVNVVRAGDLPASPISFLTNRGGYIVSAKEIF